MSDIYEAVAYYLEADGDNLFHGLLDLGPEAMPVLMDEAIKPENKDIRAELVHVIWEYRDPEAVEFLGDMLSDADPQVWKQALDGLVTIGGPGAIRQITQAQERVRLGLRNGLSDEWLSEALDHIAHGVWE